MADMCVTSRMKLKRVFRYKRRIEDSERYRDKNTRDVESHRHKRSVRVSAMCE